MSRKNKKKKSKKARAALESSAKIRGILREEHFSSGKSLSEWRGTSSVHTSRSEKKRSRSSDKKKAIEDSS